MTVSGRKKGTQNLIKTEVPKKKCIACTKPPQPLGNFFTSNNDFHKEDGLFPACKACVELSLDINDPSSVRELLTQLNRPYLHSIWLSSIEESNKTGKKLFGLYIKNVMMNNKSFTFKNSIFEKNESKENNNSNVSNQNKVIDSFKFTVTEEMIRRWGSKYEDESDYMALEDFYHSMKTSNKIETHQEETYLKKLASISLQMDKELNNGNTQQVKQLGDLFSKFMADSKFRATDKTEADKTGGIRNFSTIFSEVEKDGHIPPWEYYKKIKNIDQDIVDKTIMHIENFTLRLNKIERMVEPPDDTPKLNEDEYERVDES